MSNLLDRLKVTSIKKAVGLPVNVPNSKNGVTRAPAPKSIAMPMPTTIKVAPPTSIIKSTGPVSVGRESALIQAATAIKTAEANAVSEKQFNAELMSQLRKEYDAYIANLMASMEETGPLYFAVKNNESTKEAEPTAVVEGVETATESDNTVPQPLSVAGEVDIVPKKPRSRKKKTEE